MKKLSVKFQALDDKSFTISDFPILIGGESNIKWKIIEANQQSIQRPDQGYAIMTDLDKLVIDTCTSEEIVKQLTSLKVKKRLAFSKEPDLPRHSAILTINSSSGELQIWPCIKMSINGKEIQERTFTDLKNSDKIQFHIESQYAELPLVYHIITMERKDDEQAQCTKATVPQVFNQLYHKKLALVTNPRNPKSHIKWTVEEMQTLKKLLLRFGVGRLSKLRNEGKKSCKSFGLKEDNEIRAYTNFFLVCLAEHLDDEKEDMRNLQKSALEKITTTHDDIKIEASSYDFADNFNKLAEKWAKRLNLLSTLTHLVRTYKQAQDKFKTIAYSIQDPKLQKQYEKNKNILNFIPQQEIQVSKPAIVWDRQHDVDLIFGVYNHGFANYQDIFKDKDYIFKDQSQGKLKSNMVTRRLKYIGKLIKRHGDKFEFENLDDTKVTKEISGLSKNEKEILYEVLINYGIPVSPSDETKEDYQLLKLLLAKYAKGEDAETDLSPESIKMIEKFIQHLNSVSAKILSDYRQPVNEILKKWKEEDEADGSDDSDSKSDGGKNTAPQSTQKGTSAALQQILLGQKKDSAIPGKEDEGVNDFSIDKERIKAAHEYEKHNERLVYDPDNDGFNFGYERALTFKVRNNLFRIIRKEIISCDYKLFDQCIEALSQKLRDEREANATKLPDEWICDKHDRYLLKAVSENGLHFLSKLKENQEYGFENIRVPKKRLQNRLESLCKFFKDHLVKFRKTSAVKPGDLTTGQTQIDPKKTLNKVNVERDDQGNIKYPIVICPTLQILNLGTIEWERISYHSEKNFFPIGFKSLREYTSIFTIGQRCSYICEILDGGAKPLFKVTCSEDPKNPMIKDSSSGVWIDICKKINELQGNKRTNVTVSGPDRFGLAEPGVNQLLQCLPNAEKCARYRF